MFGQKLQKWGFGIFIFLIVISITLYLTLGDNVSTETLRQSIKDFGVWAPFLFLILYAAGTIFFPSTPFMIIAGILFGFWYGLLYTVIGGFVSSILVFEIGRKLGKTWVESALKNRYLGILKKYNERLEAGAVWDLIFFRISPIMPFNILNVLMGVSRISVKDYIIGTVLGLIPSNIITVYAGVIITKIF